MNRNVMKRIVMVIPALIIEAGIILLLATALKPVDFMLSIVMDVFGFFYMLYIITKEDESVYKILWLLIIMLFPVTGALGYLLFGDQKTGRRLKRAIEKSRAELPPLGARAETLLSACEPSDKRMVRSIAELERVTGYPVHENAGAKYYPLGDAAMADLLAELNRAERYVFIEYFIIENGILWNAVTEILARKVKEGVDVRVMYDDLGSIATFSKEDRAALEAKGIKCLAFNPLVFVLGTLNYRSHRKMTVIDGRVAFSGGINMADEYINQRKHPYGHWKDLCYRVTGGAVNNFAHMFAEFWNGVSEDKIDPALLRCREESAMSAADGFALSYYDSPLGRFNVSNSLYIDLLYQATDYVWFYTPYLLLGDRLLNALTDAARRGVDVRIIMPGIPDKKIVFRMAHAYYPALLEAGVRIFEYTPGFVHAKGCVADDRVCNIGTVNLDYRSLFLHFENSTLFYRASVLNDFKADYLATQAKCREIRKSDLKSGYLNWILDGMLRIIAPLF